MGDYLVDESAPEAPVSEVEDDDDDRASPSRRPSRELREEPTSPRAVLRSPSLNPRGLQRAHSRLSSFFGEHQPARIWDGLPPAHARAAKGERLWAPPFGRDARVPVPYQSASEPASELEAATVHGDGADDGDLVRVGGAAFEAARAQPRLSVRFEETPTPDRAAELGKTTSGRATISVSRGQAAGNQVLAQWLEKGDHLGSGTFGMVYRGSYFNQRVAIKELIVQELEPVLSRESLDEFEHEADLHYHLRHANIVELLCFNVNPDSGPTCMIMELAECSLYDVLHSGRPLPLYAGGGAMGRVKLCDFGLSVVKTEIEGSSGGKAIGSLPYMAPELMVDEPVPNLICDVYSFYVVMWEVMANAAPHDGRSPTWIVKFVSRRKKVLEVPKHVGCPERLESLMRQCARFDPADRPTMDVVLNALRDVVFDPVAPRVEIKSSTRLQCRAVLLRVELPENARFTFEVVGDVPLDVVYLKLANEDQYVAAFDDRGVARVAFVDSTIGADQLAREARGRGLGAVVEGLLFYLASDHGDAVLRLLLAGVSAVVNLAVDGVGRKALADFGACEAVLTAVASHGFSANKRSWRASEVRHVAVEAITNLLPDDANAATFASLDATAVLSRVVDELGLADAPAFDQSRQRRVAARVELARAARGRALRAARRAFAAADGTLAGQLVAVGAPTCLERLLFRSLEDGRRSTELARRACAATMALAATGDGARAALGADRVCEAVVAVVRDMCGPGHQAKDDRLRYYADVLAAVADCAAASDDDLDMQRLCCRAFWILATPPDKADAAAAPRAPLPDDKLAVVPRAMLRYGEDQQLQHFACGAVINLAATSPAVRRALGRVDACRAVAACLKRFPRDARVQEYGCRAAVYLGAGKECDIPKAPLSAVFRSFRLIFGRAIISRSALEACMLFPERARGEQSR
ncbi:serine threonine-protein kinase [Aureococcus anophagefferens]|nr:serine threonine-protein kinase [Aureococcus anophagefferens]